VKFRFAIKSYSYLILAIHQFIIIQLFTAYKNKTLK